MDEQRIIEPVGPCPITGYPLVAVHDVSGVHAGLALAELDEHQRKRADNTGTDAPPSLHIASIATPAELLRSWTELLLFAVAARLTATPDHAAKDYTRCRDLILTRHHYDTSRIIASVHVTAVEHLRNHEGWAPPALALLPDVGVDHVRSTAQTAIHRLAGTTEAIPEAVDRLRHTYVQRLAETT